MNTVRTQAPVATGLAIAIAAGIALLASAPGLRFDGWREACLIALTVAAWGCALQVHADALAARDVPAILRSPGVLLPWGWAAYAVLAGRPDPHLVAAAVGTALIVLCHHVEHAARVRGPGAPRWYAPSVLLGTAATTGVWWAADDLSSGVGAGLAVLLIGAPVPTALAAALTHLLVRRRGIAAGYAIPDDGTLHVIARIDTIVLDKDGTVTTGRLRVTDVEPIEPDHDRNLRWFAGALEHASDHPVGRAIARLSASGRPTGVQQHPGLGISGSIDRHPVRVGDPAWLGMSAKTGIGATIGVEVDGRPMGRLTVWDDVRDNAQGSLEALHALGIRTVLLSPGDPTEADHLATLVSPSTTYARVDEQKRLAVIRELCEADRHVAYVGPAAAGRDADGCVSVAFGTSSPAGVILTDLDAARLPTVVAVCRAATTRSLLGQRVALLATLTALVVAMAGLLPPLAAALIAVGICALTALTLTGIR